MLITLLGLWMVLILTVSKNFADVHKFQLYGYYMNQYLGSVFKTKSKWMKPYDFVYFTGLMLAFLTEFWLLRITGILLLLLHFYFFKLIVKAYPAKKKCVYTPRVKRMLITASLMLVLLSVVMFFLPTWTLAVWGALAYVMSFIWIYLANTINKPIENLINQYY